MFCYQCEQTAKGQGCETIGVCGKKPEVAALQDLLLYAVKGLSQYAVAARGKNIRDEKVSQFINEAVFSTLTNVNFDPDRFVDLIQKTVKFRDEVKGKLAAAGGAVGFSDGPALFKPESTLDGLVAQGEKTGIKTDSGANPDILSLKQLLTYGIKGVAAYADHAMILGKKDDAVFDFIQDGLAATLDPGISVDALIGLVLKCGEANLKAMELLDAANTGAYGHPTPTKVPLYPKRGKAILVSGHDLRDLEEILKQTENKGIYVYTHGEMLPCHGYPGLKKYAHFYGHYGTAWQNQAKEFEAFPGAIVMTTNCIQKPRETYQNHIFTTGLVGWPGVRHLSGKNFAPVIEKALQMEGFKADGEGKSVMVGFARNAVMGVAGAVIDAVKNKQIRHFFSCWRVRRRQARSELLYGICGKSPQRLRGADPRLREVPVF